MMVYARAPLRICDLGSWSDTAFAEHGAAWNCAIEHYVRVLVRPACRSGLALTLEHRPPQGDVPPGRDPDLRAFLHVAARHFALRDLEVFVRADLPPGCGAGARAATRIALAAALARCAGMAHYPHHLALIAHRLQTDEVGGACGLQSFLAAAVGGAALYRLAPYPRVFIEPLPPAGRAGMAERLVFVLTRRPAVENYCRQFERRWRAREQHSCAALWRLRTLPELALRAAADEDWPALAAVMAESVRLQHALFPARRTPEVAHLDRFARRRGALAVKPNGNGGSLAILCATPPQAHDLRAELALAGYPVLPARIAEHGVEVWSAEEKERIDEVEALGGRTSPRRQLSR